MINKDLQDKLKSIIQQLEQLDDNLPVVNYNDDTGVMSQCSFDIRVIDEDGMDTDGSEYPATHIIVTK